MANFYADNGDIQFHLDHMDLEPLVRLREPDFEDAAVYDYAPADVADAVDNYRRVLDLVGGIAGDTIAPLSPQIDTDGSHLDTDAGCVRYAPGIRKALDVLAQADLMGATLPRRFGGLNLPGIIYAMATEIVSRADASLMNIFGLQGIAETINMFASEEQKREFLPRFAAGQVTGAMVLTEPDAGSDLQNIQLRAYQDETGQWRLQGVKRFITNGCGEVLLVLARSETDETGGMGLSLFLAERDPAIRIRRTEVKMGIHGSPTCEMQFNDAPAQLVGERRRGLVTYVMALMNGARIGIAAQSLGIAEAALRVARNYAATRVQFGRTIDRFPAVADLLAEMKLAIESGRALLYEATLAADFEYALEAAMQREADSAKRSEINKEQKKYKRLAAFLTPVAKYYLSEMCNRVAYEAISVLGGSGYMKDYPLEQLYRDARITSIYEGTSQLQVLAAVRGVTSGTAEKRFAELAAGAAPEGFDAEAAQLAETRKKLAAAVEYVKKQPADYVDLCARPLVDVAADVYLGYLWLGMARHSAAKAARARRFISRAVPRCDGALRLMMSGDRSTLDAFDALVGPTFEEV
ncbi:MAG: acyl-CoA dehydrogenase family protein [Planctomycetota bacterium]|nr:acyl-CoA dehydrogenase family protein [Planctomycetota bacterium]